METAKNVTKITVDCLVGYGIGSAVGTIIRQTVRPVPNPNPIVNVLLIGSSVATAVAVTGWLHDRHVKPYTDIEIDKLFALIEHHSK